jgi:hypothetical protein
VTHGKIARVRGCVRRVLGRYPRLEIAQHRRAAAVPGPAHELGLGHRAATARPSGEENGVRLVDETGGVGEARGADRMEPVASSARIAEDDDEPPPARFSDLCQLTTSRARLR